MTAFKEGDLVSIEATVKFTAEEGRSVYLEIPGHFTSISLNPAFVKMVRPKFEIGEEVKCRSDDGSIWRAARVLGMAGDEVWLEFTQGDYAREVVSISDVARPPRPSAAKKFMPDAPTPGDAG